MAKAPRPGTTHKTPGIAVGFGDNRWVFHADAITPKDVADLRRATGLGTRDVFQALAEGRVDLDIAGALVFLARRQIDGRWINFEMATDGLTYDTEFRIDAADPADEDSDSPEA